MDCAVGFGFGIGHRIALLHLECISPRLGLFLETTLVLLQAPAECLCPVDLAEVNLSVNFPDILDAFAQAAQARGLMVRPFAGEGARVSIGEPAGNDVLLSFR